MSNRTRLYFALALFAGIMTGVVGTLLAAGLL